MNSTDTSFSTLLERYMFGVAEQTVDLIDRQEQDRLVRLLITIDTATASIADTGDAVEDVLLTFLSTLTVPPGKADERRLTYTKGPHNEERRRLLEALIAGHQQRIDSTLGYLSRLDALLERVEKTATGSPQKANLTEHYQSLRKGYLAVLVRVRALQTKQQTKLDRYHQE